MDPIAEFGRLRGRGRTSIFPAMGGAEFDTEMAALIQRLRTAEGTGAGSSTRVRMEAWRVGDLEKGSGMCLPLVGPEAAFVGEHA